MLKDGHQWKFLVLGLLFGGFSIRLYDQHDAARSTHVFQQRLKCSSLADKYEDSHSSIPGFIFQLQMADYSTASNRCFAGLTVIAHLGDMTTENWILVDLMSKRESIVADCHLDNVFDCKEKTSDAEKLKTAFNSVMNGGDFPSN